MALRTVGLLACESQCIGMFT